MPEQIEREKRDGRSDICSVGAVLYHLVTGHPPFEGEDGLTVAFRHVHEATQPPRQLNAAVPEDWEAVIAKALAKSPNDRFQTAAELEAAISALSAPTAEVPVGLPWPQEQGDAPPQQEGSAGAKQGEVKFVAPRRAWQFWGQRSDAD